MLITAREGPADGSCAMCLAEGRRGAPDPPNIIEPHWRGQESPGERDENIVDIPSEFQGMRVCGSHIAAPDIKLWLLAEAFPITTRRIHVLADGTAVKPGMLVERNGNPLMVYRVNVRSAFGHRIDEGRLEYYAVATSLYRLAKGHEPAAPVALDTARRCRQCGLRDTWIRYPSVAMHWCHRCYRDYLGVARDSHTDTSVYLDS
jgi:hypothetical protein